MNLYHLANSDCIVFALQGIYLRTPSEVNSHHIKCTAAWHFNFPCNKAHVSFSSGLIFHKDMGSFREIVTDIVLLLDSIFLVGVGISQRRFFYVDSKQMWNIFQQKTFYFEEYTTPKASHPVLIHQSFFNLQPFLPILLK